MDRHYISTSLPIPLPYLLKTAISHCLCPRHPPVQSAVQFTNMASRLLLCVCMLSGLSESIKTLLVNGCSAHQKVAIHQVVFKADPLAPFKHRKQLTMGPQDVTMRPAACP